MIGRALRSQQGSTLVTSLILLTVVLGLGLALLTVVETQARQSGAQREEDAAMNLAETALDAASFLLAHGWPTAASSEQPWTQVASCRQQDISGGVTEVANASTLAQRIQNRVADLHQARGSAATATWSVKVCDDSGAVASAWTDAAGLGQVPFDANGEQTRTDPSTGTSFRVRRLWVRAQATVDGHTKGVAALTQLNVVPAMPTGYSVLTGRLGFGSGVSATLQSLLTGSSTGPFLQSLVGQPRLTSGGTIGIRCGLLADMCLESVATTLTRIPLTENLGVVGSGVQQYGSPTAASAQTIANYRQQAARNGTYVTKVAGGQPCIPTGTATTSATVVFVDAVGDDGRGQCTLPAGRTVGLLVVGSGRVRVTGSGTVHGVVYALNGQDAERSESVVSFDQGSRLTGAVFVDGGGVTDFFPPSFSVAQLLANLRTGTTDYVCGGSYRATLANVPVVKSVLQSLFGLVGSILNPLVSPTCSQLVDALDDLGLETLVSTLESTVPVPAVVSALTAQLSSYGPVVTYDAAAVNALTAFGSSGTIQGSYREVGVAPTS